MAFKRILPGKTKTVPAVSINKNGFQFNTVATKEFGIKSDTRVVVVYDDEDPDTKILGFIFTPDGDYKATPSGKSSVRISASNLDELKLLLISGQKSLILFKGDVEEIREEFPDATLFLTSEITEDRTVRTKKTLEKIES